MAPGNVIYIYKFMTVRQDVTPTFCSLDVNHANELLMQLCSADEHFNPNHLLACWCHTHPGFSVTPSAVDWNTFDDIDSPDWAAMIILNKKLEMGAHVRQRGPLYSPVRKVDVSVDWERLPDCLDEIRRDDWEAEYMTNVWPSAQRHQPGYLPLGKATSRMPATLRRRSTTRSVCRRAARGSTTVTSSTTTESARRPRNEA
jgi:hypothetical protein